MDMRKTRAWCSFYISSYSKALFRPGVSIASLFLTKLVAGSSNPPVTTLATPGSPTPRWEGVGYWEHLAPRLYVSHDNYIQ